MIYLPSLTDKSFIVAGLVTATAMLSGFTTIVAQATADAEQARGQRAPSVTRSAEAGADSRRLRDTSLRVAPTRGDARQIRTVASR